MTSNNQEQYDVVLSFAGEQRPYAENIAKIIRKNGFRVFYDDWEQDSVWGEELNRYFAKIYGEAGRYCVMLISKEYKAKPYPYRERLAAVNRFIEHIGSPYLLPIRIDDTEIPELPLSVAHVDLRKINIIDCGELLIKKLGSSTFIIPDDLDFSHLVIDQKGMPDIRRHLKSLSASVSNIVECPTCNAPFDVTTVPLTEDIVCPICKTQFNAKAQIEQLINNIASTRGKNNEEIGRIITIKIMKGTHLTNTLTCCHCRRTFEWNPPSNEEWEQKSEGNFIGLYNRTIGKTTFLFFCKNCLYGPALASDIDIDSSNMYPGFTYD